MCRKLYLSMWLVLTLGIVGTACAVEIKVDFGGVGTLDGTWTQWNAHSGNLTVDGVQFTLSNTNQANGPKIRVGIGDALTMETLGSDNECVGGVYTLVITNLPAGDYNLDTYFNNPTTFEPPWNEGGAQEVWVNGAMLAGPSPASYQETSANALVLSVSFTSSGTSDVITIDWKNSALPSNWICGFELISTAAMLRFATAESGDFEAVSPAEVEVIVMNADEAQSYTVDYEVIGGTAVKDQDYTVTEPATLTFNPGETNQVISIDIIEDALEEDDETIILELSTPTGPNAVLGDITQHTYTIRDPRPAVGFETDHSIDSEDAGVVSIPVSLSFAGSNTVTVDYAVVGGTATGGGVDYTLTPGTLTFYAGQTTKSIDVTVVDDGLDEEDETIVIGLSEPVGGKSGSIMEHTLTIADPTALVLSVDLALEDPFGSGIPRPATAKPGWTAWTPVGLGDMYMHDWRGIRDLGGTGIDASMTAGREGTNGIKCYDMCMDNKAGGWPPTGSPVGGAIANTWYTSVDRVSFPQACVMLALYNLPVGRYGLVSYHNLWEPCGDGVRECTKCGYSGQAMPNVHVWSYEDANDFGQWLGIHYPQYAGQFWDGFRKIKGFGGPPPHSTNVVAIEEDCNVMPSSTTNDDEVTKSLVKFWTDGSPVIIMYESGDCITTQYIGCRGVLNAFRVVSLADIQFASCPYPVDGGEDVPLDASLSWEAGLDAAWHDVYFGTDANAVRDATTIDHLGVYKGTQSGKEYTPPALELGMTYYWRIDEVNDPNFWPGGVWSFTVDTGQARNPSPAHGATDVNADASLSWTAGVAAASHDVYFGTDLEAVSNATTGSTEYKGNQSLGNESYDLPGLLALGTTYYWRIDERNLGHPNSTGEVWDFTTMKYLVLDDMEDYNDFTNPIFYTWLDGWREWPPVNGSFILLGSIDNTPPDPVHGGRQSMWYFYDNTGADSVPYYSEAERAIFDPYDWLAFGARVLSLYFYGDPNNDANVTEQMYVMLDDADSSAVIAYGRYAGQDMNDIKKHEWQEWNIALQDFADAGVDLTDVTKLYIGFGDRDSQVPGGSGEVYFDDIRLYGRKCVAGGPYADLTGDCRVNYHDLKILGEQWLATGSVSADLYIDSQVDLRDYAVLAAGWLEDKLWPPE